MRNSRRWTLGCACVAAWLTANAAPAAAQESRWVKTGVTGRLVYVPDAEGDRIADFSMVGYGAGKKAIPSDVPVVIHIDPLAGDNTQHIQDAINFASSLPTQANGFRGAVELGPGKFNVDGHVSITASGVVLRGAGAGDSLATNTHIVSQNRTDSISSASTPVINIQGSSSGTTRGSQIPIVDKVVPVGAQSFRVASTAGMAVGGMVEIFRPSTQAWIEALGMHLIPDGKEWSAGDQELRWHRTITRIEGNRVFVDAPITTALDAQYGGGTIRTYSSPNRIRNVGVENLRGQSLDDREETNEARTPSFVRFTRVDDGYVRDVETRHFSYASVFTSEADGTQHITVDNVSSRLPSGVVTGGRRYSFAMDGQMSLVQNSFADSGRHDFVTGSAVTGPIVFRNSSTANTRADAGPHHRWGNGLLFDGIDVNGNAINVQNRWTSGSGHGWAGANVVIWNSEANSFIVQSPPTAQSWLIGSTGTINPGDCHLSGAGCAGYYDSHGTKVVAGGELSLYDAQLNDSSDLREFHWGGGDGAWTNPAEWAENAAPGLYRVSLRDYMLGDADNYTLDAGAVDTPFVAPAWSATVDAGSPAPVLGFDRAGANHDFAMTMQNILDPGERAIHGFLAMSLRQVGASSANDFVQLFDATPENRRTFADLGWAGQVNATTPFVGVIDLGGNLDHLQTGAVNVWVGDSTSVDWAIYTVAVTTPKAGPTSAAVFLDGGAVRVDSIVAPILSLTNGGPGDSELTIGAAGRLPVAGPFAQAPNGSLVAEIGGAAPGQFGALVVAGQAQLGGAVALRLVNGYAPAIGAEFAILTAPGGLAGTFDDEVRFDLAGAAVWEIDYQTNAVIARVIAGLPGDLTGDSAVDAADWTKFKAGQGADFTGLSSTDAYLLGDLNGDGDHDLSDFSLFRTAFDGANGAGSFVRMLRGVPEPPGASLFLTAVILSAAKNLGRRSGRSLRSPGRCQSHA